MKCSVCEVEVVDGVLVLEAGVARHVACEPASERKTRVTLSLTRACIATFEELGGGNASAGARLAGLVVRSLSEEDLRRIREGLETRV